MLKELNGIASGLLGLHGYPTRPFSSMQASESTPTAPLSEQKKSVRKDGPATDRKPVLNGRAHVAC